MADEINSFTQSVYQLDYEGLDIPTPTDADEGKVLTAKGLGESEWKNVNGSLPVIGDSDDGKVLTVDDGEAVWAEAGGGSSACVTYLATAGENDDYTIEASFDDIFEAVQSGIAVFVILPFAEITESPVLYTYGLCPVSFIKHDATLGSPYSVIIYDIADDTNFEAEPSTSTENLVFTVESPK